MAKTTKVKKEPISNLDQLRKDQERFADRRQIPSRPNRNVSDINLDRLRNARGRMTQRELARQMGVCFTHVCAMEKGIRNITLPNLRKWATILGINYKELLPDSFE